MKDTQKETRRNKGKEIEDGFLEEMIGQEEKEKEEEGEDRQGEEAANNNANHKYYNCLNCDWFKETPISHYLTWQLVIGQFVIGQLVIGQFVIGQFVIGQFNKPITFKILV